MSELPAPMTPAECDLRGFMEWSRFFGEKAFKSRWYRAAMKDPRGGIAALKLWWEAMQQCPAGSLPNDEEELCWLADFGQDIRSWRKHRAVAMHGFVLCADNRWYHPFLAEEAMAAWARRRNKDHERELWRTQKQRQRASCTNGESQDVRPDMEECPPGHTGGQEQMSTETSSGMSASRAGLEEKEREKRRQVPPRSPPADAGGRRGAPKPRYRNGFRAIPLEPLPGATIEGTAEDSEEFQAFRLKIVGGRDG